MNIQNSTFNFYFFIFYSNFKMNTNQGIISLTKWITGASFVILAVGIMFVPSDEEKIRKMKVSLLIDFFFAINHQRL